MFYNFYKWFFSQTLQIVRFAFKIPVKTNSVDMAVLTIYHYWFCVWIPKKLWSILQLQSIVSSELFLVCSSNKCFKKIQIVQVFRSIERFSVRFITSPPNVYIHTGNKKPLKPSICMHSMTFDYYISFSI